MTFVPKLAIRAALWGPPAIGLVALALRQWHAWAVWQLALVASAPYLMLIVPVGIVFAWVRRSWWMTAASTLVAATCVATQAPLYLANTLPVQPERLHVMTQNADVGQARARQILNTVRSHRVDVLVITELTPALQRRLREVGLERELPFAATQPRPAARGTGIWSRYRLDHVRFVRGYGCTFVTAIARFGWTNGPASTRLVGLHLVGPTWDAAEWRRDAQRLPGTLKPLSRSATVVAGDFNATPDSPWLRDALTSGFTNAEDDAGAGLVRTYPSSHPVLAIDHVLTSQLIARSVTRVRIAGTDHRGIIATIASPVS